jgi:hypothetical protein
MSEPIPKQAAEAIDAISADLISEFHDHVRQLQEQFPGNYDVRAVFEGWAIQKLAALQFTTLHLAAELAELRRKLIGGNGG